MKGLPLTAALAVIASVCVAPFYWLVVAATHEDREIFAWPPKFLPGGHFDENLAQLEEQVGLTRAVVNTLVIAGAETVGGIILALLAGYAFAKFDFRGRNALFLLLMSVLVVPDQVMLVPLFEMMMRFGLMDSAPSVILPSLYWPFALFFMRQALSQVPDELIDAARVDGAGELRILLRVIVPVMRPAIAAASVFVFLQALNQFVWPLLTLRSPENQTLPVALATLHGQVSNTDYGAILAGTAVSAIPMMVLFLLLQRQFISGLLAGATKG